MCYHYTTAANNNIETSLLVYSAFPTIAIYIIGLHVLNAILARSGDKWRRTNKKPAAIITMARVNDLNQLLSPALNLATRKTERCHTSDDTQPHNHEQPTSRCDLQRVASVLSSSIEVLQPALQHLPPMAMAVPAFYGSTLPYPRSASALVVETADTRG